MIQIDQLFKKYHQQTAVDGISLRVEEGEFYGLLGPNGAGKTTTITMISGILPPDAGVIRLRGADVYAGDPRIKRLMGIVPQEIALYDDLSAYANLLFWGGLYHIKGQTAQQRARDLLEWVGLSDRMRDQVKTYSGGMKRRVNIAAALMHDPALVIMDEPTVGIDPHSRNKIYTLLEDLHAQGKTILYTTHYMEEAERMCDRIGIIDKGKIIAEGTLNELKQTHAQHETIVIHYSGNHITEPAGYTCTLDEQEQTLTILLPEARKSLHEIVQLMQQQAVEIAHIDIHHAGLESIFLQLTGRQLRD